MRTHLPLLALAPLGLILTSGAPIQSMPSTRGCVPTAGAGLAIRCGDTSLRTLSMARGGISLETAGRARAVGDGAVEQARSGGAVLERAERAGESVEHSWRFERAPDGSGDLVVRVGVAGARAAGAQAGGGLGFAGAGGEGLVYGAATWVDARGRRVAVAARPVGDDAVEITVPQGVLTASSYPAVLDPLVSPAMRLTSPAYTTGPGDLPDVAFDGSNYFVAYADLSNSATDVRVARVTPAGAALDAPSIALGTFGGATPTAPAVACGAGECMVVWSDTSTVRGVRVSAAGDVLDQPPLDLAQGRGSLPDVVFDGTNFVVAWYDAGIVGARFTPAGTRTDTQFLRFSAATLSTPTRPALAFDGTYTLAAWTDHGFGGGSDVVRVRRLSGTTAADASDVTISTEAGAKGSPSAASSGTEFLVSWSTTDASNRTHARVAAVGATAGPLAVIMESSFGTGAIRYPTSVAFDGTNYLVLWGAMTGERFARTGLAVDTTVQSYAPAQPGGYLNGAVGFGAGQYLVTSGLIGNNGTGVFGARVQPNGTLTDATTALVISRTLVDDRFSSVGFDGTNYLAVWSSAGALPGSYGVQSARIAADGTQLPPGVSTLVSGQTFGPRVAFNGSEYLLVWYGGAGDPRTIYARRLAPDGTVIDVADIQLASGLRTAFPPSDLQVASDGHDFLVTWADYQSTGFTPSNFEIAARRVGGDGTLLDAAPLVIHARDGSTDMPQSIRLAYGAGTYFVAWSPKIQAGVRGTAISSAGVVANPEGVSLVTSSLPTGDPVIAGGSTGFLLGWNEYEGTGAAVTVHVKYSLMAPDGTLASPAGTEVMRESNFLGDHYAAYSGGSWLLAYHNEDVPQAFLVSVDAAGAVIDTTTVDALDSTSSLSALTAGPAGEFLLAGESLDAVSNARRGWYRLVRRTASGGDAGVADASSGDDVVVVADAGVDDVLDASMPVDVPVMDDVLVADVANDAGAVDAGAVDAAGEDVAVADVPVVLDASSSDAAHDSGAVADARADGATSDAGSADVVDESGGLSGSGGCNVSCGVRPSHGGSGAAGASLALSTVALAALDRRRRRNR